MCWQISPLYVACSVKMWRAAFLLLAASLSVSLARPRFKPLSSEMVNYINKVNTTWKVIFFFFVCLSYLGLFASVCLSSYIWLHLLPLLQAGHNFHNVDFSYVQRLCGTMLKGPKLPVMWVSLILCILAYECNRVHFFLQRRKSCGFNVTEKNSISQPSHYVWKSTLSIAYIAGVSCSST